VRQNKASILLVEDDSNLGFVLKDFLEISGYAVALAKDGEDGLYQFRNGNFDLCVLDVMLPNKDGFSLAKDITAINTDIPFIFLTAKNMEKDKIEGLKIGADDYITKPFSTEELSLRIEAILRRSKYSILKNDIPAVFNLVI
jgi:two-component system response regulator VicR